MKKSILYVDDEEANLRTFTSVFRRDYSVYTALSGEEGLLILERENLDVLITDQCMPGMSGVEFLKHVFERTPMSPPSRIMLSGFAEEKDVHLAREEYMLQQFVSKPWGYEEMKKIIDDVILNT